MKNFRTLKVGDKVRVGYKSWNGGTLSTFLGFSDWDAQYGKGGSKFDDWAALSKDKGVKTFADLDAKQANRQYGYGCYALFLDSDGCSTFAVYLYNNAWRVGSSADRAKLSD